MVINKYTKALDSALEQYIPLPFDTLMKAGQATQQRYDQSIADDTALQTGLASIEARSPGYKQYIDKTIASYRENMAGLIKQYNGRLDDPEFKRQAKEVQNRYANDPAFQTIKIGNEAIKRSQDLEARMRTEGKLYISDLPNFTGTDANGRLTAYNGSPSAVNTLDDWAKAGSIAHSSKEDIGTRTTNEGNLKRWRQTLSQDAAGQAKLQQAYMQQGMTHEQAQNAVKSSIQGLINQYGVDSKLNTGLMGLQQSAYQFNVTRNDRLNDQAADRANKLEIARLKAAGKDANGEDIIKAPSFNEFTNRSGSIGTIMNEKGDKEIGHIFGSGKSQYGTKNVPVKHEKITGTIYDIGSGSLYPKSKTIDIIDGTLKGYMNAWVNKKTGELIRVDSPTARPKIEYINGKPFAYMKGKPYEIEERTMAEYNYNAGTKDDPQLKTIYQEASPKDAMREMGYSNAYYKNMGQTQHGSVIDRTGKAKLDYNFIKKNIASSNEDLLTIKQAEANYNKGVASEKEKALLQFIGSYDTRKPIYDKEILPYFKDQSKTKTIVTEE